MKCKICGKNKCINNCDVCNECSDTGEQYKEHEHYHICEGRGKESTCGKIFFNDDDSVCKYCGSKNTSRIIIEKMSLYDEYLFKD